MEPTKPKWFSIEDSKIIRVSEKPNVTIVAVAKWALKEIQGEVAPSVQDLLDIRKALEKRYSRTDKRFIGSVFQKIFGGKKLLSKIDAAIEYRKLREMFEWGKDRGGDPNFDVLNEIGKILSNSKAKQISKKQRTELFEKGKRFLTNLAQKMCAEKYRVLVTNPELLQVENQGKSPISYLNECETKVAEARTTQNLYDEFQKLKGLEEAFEEKNLDKPQKKKDEVMGVPVVHSAIENEISKLEELKTTVFVNDRSDIIQGQLTAAKEAIVRKERSLKRLQGLMDENKKAPTFIKKAIQDEIERVSVLSDVKEQETEKRLTEFIAFSNEAVTMLREEEQRLRDVISENETISNFLGKKYVSPQILAENLVQLEDIQRRSDEFVSIASQVQSENEGLLLMVAEIIAKRIEVIQASCSSLKAKGIDTTEIEKYIEKANKKPAFEELGIIQKNLEEYESKLLERYRSLSQSDLKTSIYVDEVQQKKVEKEVDRLRLSLQKPPPLEMLKASGFDAERFLTEINKSLEKVKKEVSQSNQQAAELFDQKKKNMPDIVALIDEANKIMVEATQTDKKRIEEITSTLEGFRNKTEDFPDTLASKEEQERIFDAVSKIPARLDEVKKAVAARRAALQKLETLKKEMGDILDQTLKKKIVLAEKKIAEWNPALEQGSIERIDQEIKAIREQNAQHQFTKEKETVRLRLRGQQKTLTSAIQQYQNKTDVRALESLHAQVLRWEEILEKKASSVEVMEQQRTLFASIKQAPIDRTIQSVKECRERHIKEALKVCEELASFQKTGLKTELTNIKQRLSEHSDKVLDDLCKNFVLSKSALEKGLLERKRLVEELRRDLEVLPEAIGDKIREEVQRLDSWDPTLEDLIKPSTGSQKIDISVWGSMKIVVVNEVKQRAAKLHQEEQAFLENKFLVPPDLTQLIQKYDELVKELLEPANSERKKAFSILSGWSVAQIAKWEEIRKKLLEFGERKEKLKQKISLNTLSDFGELLQKAQALLPPRTFEELKTKNKEIEVLEAEVTKKEEARKQIISDIFSLQKEFIAAANLLSKQAKLNLEKTIQEACQNVEEKKDTELKALKDRLITAKKNLAVENNRNKNFSIFCENATKSIEVQGRLYPQIYKTEFVQNLKALQQDLAQWSPTLESLQRESLDVEMKREVVKKQFDEVVEKFTGFVRDLEQRMQRFEKTIAWVNRNRASVEAKTKELFPDKPFSLQKEFLALQQSSNFDEQERKLSLIEGSLKEQIVSLRNLLQERTQRIHKDLGLDPSSRKPKNSLDEAYKEFQEAKKQKDEWDTQTR